MSNGTDMALISELVARERLFRARHNPEIRDCYYADATVATSWQQGPLSTFIGAESKEVDPRFVIVGSVSTPVVHLNGNKAYVELPTTTHMRMMINGTLAELESYRRLIYRVERRDTKWKISRLTSINESDNLRPVIAGQDLHVIPQDFNGLRPSYQFLAYVRQAAGGQISQDLLGTDRPEEVERLYKETNAWLRAGV
ncbi:hypothetical protein Nizo1840_0942 [Lactiplantibacillus plantarum]|nr:hypothetical protein Nizo1840_0942 [Lactiplantibacillus plantarum]